MITNWTNSYLAWQDERKVVGGGVASAARLSARPHPIFMSGASGSRITDIDGNEYIDFVLGWGPVIAGHSHPAIVEAVRRQADLAFTYGSNHLLEAEAARKVLQHVRGGEKLLWTNTGSEATQIALRLARAHTGRRRVVKFIGNYHGWSDQFLVGYRPDASGNLAGLGTPGQSPSVLGDVVLLPWGDLDALEDSLSGNHDVASVFMDAVMSNSGTFDPPDGYLDGVRRLCDREGVVLVLDEVLTGFRVGLGGAAAAFDIDADLLTLAKAIGNGATVAAVAGRADLIDQVEKGVNHSGTYNGNPLSLAAVSATMDVLSKPDAYAGVHRQSHNLVTGVQHAFDAVGIPATVNGLGGLIHCLPGVADGRDFAAYLASDFRIYDRIAVELLKRNVFVPVGGRIYLSLAHTDEDVVTTVACYHDALEAVAEQGIPPVPAIS